MSHVESAESGNAQGAPRRLDRTFSLWSSFSFSLAFISPVIALYGVFDLALLSAGPSFWLAFPVIFAAQLLIAVALGELVSRWPIEGSIYQWSRRLSGATAGWFGGWIYIWTLVVSMASVATGAAVFLAQALQWNVTNHQLALITIGILAVGSVINVAGSLALRVVIICSVIAETLSTVGLGFLLLFHRHQHLSVLTHGGAGGLSHAYLTGPFLLGIAILGYSFVGFESAGSMAEEVRNPRRTLPKAMIFSMAFVAVIVSFAGLMLILSTPSLSAVANGSVADPVYNTLTVNLGSSVARVAEFMFTVAFLASFLAVQTTASRMVWSYARDGALPGARHLSRLTASQKEPILAVLAVALVAAIFVGLSQQTPKVYQLLVNFSAAGFFCAYLFPLTGSVIARLRGTWTPGPFTLGRWGTTVAVAAWLCAAAELINIAWPRDVYPDWYLNWSVWIALAVISTLGLAIFTYVKPRLTTVTTQEIEELSPPKTSAAAPVTISEAVWK